MILRGTVRRRPRWGQNHRLDPWNLGRVIAFRLERVSSLAACPNFMRIRTPLAQVIGLGRSSLLLLGLFLIGCATPQHTGKRGLPQREGRASYYAEKFVGRTTANGEVFDQEALTAAHRSLPFGTRVRVTRINHVETPSVVVRINDRGPFKRGRIVDLSKKAARRLQMIRDGVAEVRLEVVSYPAGMKVASSDSSEADSSGSGASNVSW